MKMKQEKFLKGSFVKLKDLKTSVKFRTVTGKVYRKFTTDLGNQQLCHDLLLRKLVPLSHDLEVEIVTEEPFRNV
jgi:hypothetical protein